MLQERMLKMKLTEIRAVAKELGISTVGRPKAVLVKVILNYSWNKNERAEEVEEILANMQNKG